MLALTRRPGECIVIGDNVVVTVVEIKGDNIRLSIDAPREIKIYRGELYNAIATENKQAAGLFPIPHMDMLKNLQIKK